MKTNLISIVGAGHSGSTLLDLILGSHSNTFSMGEVSRLDNYRVNQKPCTCGLPVKSCTFWSQVLSLWEEYLASSKYFEVTTDVRGHKINGLSNQIRYRLAILNTLLLPVHRNPNLIKFVSPLLHERRKLIIDLFQIVRQVSGKSVLIDSSKSIHRFRLLHGLEPERNKAIFLSRDARAIVASKLRRLEWEPTRSAKEWRTTNIYTTQMMKTLPRSAYIHVRYEELCNSPKETVQRICTFTGIPFEPQMLQFRSAEHHNIGGNPMRMEGADEIREDLKWRTVLANEHLESFEKIAGELNRRLLGEYYVP
ncbi:MAG: sulfotransferase [Chloroflexota bacterium]